MNITKLLQLLTEGREVEDINEKLKGKVDVRVLDTLGSLMKKGKYDNIAMAIFDALQEWKDDDDYDEKREFLLKRPRLVYAAMKEAAKGNSSFDPERELNFFKFSNDEPIKFWSAYRSIEKERKENKEPKTTFGLKDARVKELPESFLFFPRNFKFEFPQYGFRLTDTDKQYQDLKALSQQMAAKDTSGETYNEGKATDNHWCVASDNPTWFKGRTYKGSHPGGFFVVIVNKNKDGSPNWNERFLLWVYPQKYYNGNKEHVEAETELADKFNRHYGFGMLPDSTEEFIEKNIINKVKRVLPKGDEQREELTNRARKAYEDDIRNNRTKDGWRRKIDTQSPVFKNYIKILRFLRNKYREQRPVDDVISATKNAIQAFIKKGINSFPDYFETTIGGYDFRFRYNPHIKKYFMEVKRDEDRNGPQITFTPEEFKQVAQNFDTLKRIDYDKWRKIAGLQPDFKSKAYGIFDTTPSKKVKDVLLNNKLAMSEYEGVVSRNNNDEIREFFVGPHFYIESRSDGFNTVSFLKTPWDELVAKPLGDLADDNIVDKVKKIYAKEIEGKPINKISWGGGVRKVEDTFPDKNVAEGPEKA